MPISDVMLVVVFIKIGQLWKSLNEGQAVRNLQARCKEHVHRQHQTNSSTQTMSYIYLKIMDLIVEI